MHFAYLPSSEYMFVFIASLSATFTMTCEFNLGRATHFDQLFDSTCVWFYRKLIFDAD